jgi:hypothetical protein
LRHFDKKVVIHCWRALLPRTIQRFNEEERGALQFFSQKKRKLATPVSTIFPLTFSKVIKRRKNTTLMGGDKIPRQKAN